MKKFPIVSTKEKSGKICHPKWDGKQKRWPRHRNNFTSLLERSILTLSEVTKFFFVKLFYEIMAGLSCAALGAGTAVTFRKQQIFLDVKKWPLRQKTRANNCIHKVQQHLNLPLWLVLIVTKYNRGQYLASKFRPSLNFGVSPPSHHSTTPLGLWCCCDCWWRNVRESRQKLRKSPNKICENSPPIYDVYLGTYYFVCKL